MRDQIAEKSVWKAATFAVPSTLLRSGTAPRAPRWTRNPTPVEELSELTGLIAARMQQQPNFEERRKRFNLNRRNLVKGAGASLATLAAAPSLFAAGVQAGAPQQSPSNHPFTGKPQPGGAGRERRMQWWHDARFGMFIHFGVYSSIHRAFRLAEKAVCDGCPVARIGENCKSAYRAFVLNISPPPCPNGCRCVLHSLMRGSRSHQSIRPHLQANCWRSTQHSYITRTQLTSGYQFLFETLPRSSALRIAGCLPAENHAYGRP